MNKKRTHVLSAIIWLLSVVSVFGQVGFSLPSMTQTTPGQQLDVPVTVINFDTVFSVQYVIQWNPQVLQLDSVTLPANPLNLVDSVNFNITESAQGIIRLRWNTSLPKTLVDGKDIFHLRMTVVGNNGTSSSIVFTELPPITYFEVVRGPGNQFFTLNNALLTNGFIGVGTVSVHEPLSTEASIRLSVAPNPFSDITTLTTNLQNSAQVTLIITDIAGKICYTEKKYLERGINGTEIANSVLPGAGLYFIHLLTPDAHAVQPIVLK